MTLPPGAIEQAAALMAAFAARTGLTSDRPARRYLWTDAFAVCNWLALWRATGEQRHAQLALQLVDQVHRVLGRHRDDDARAGWISGLGEDEGAAHPTRGGLRIGKPLPERRPGAWLDEQLEWDRDGQYFHYLTKWMHALDQVARSTQQGRFNRWARELAAAAHAAFASGPPAPGSRRMVWKMSTDLSRALVPSMGQHDPLDGLITCTELAATAAQLPDAAGGPDLAPAIADFAAMTATIDPRTTDALGLGGLLADAARAAQLLARGAPLPQGLPGELLAAAHEGLQRYARQGDLQRPAAQRLGFRELGLAIGLAALELLRREVAAARGGMLDGAGVRAQLERLEPQRALGAAIVSFWLDAAHQQARTWSEHRDINDVMLATCLLPEGFLVLSPGA